MCVAAVLRCGEIDIISADVVPDFLTVAWRPVAVEVTEVAVDFVQVPLLRMEVGMGGIKKERKK